MMKVLVVDGHPEQRRAVVAALSRLEGVAVQCALFDLETATRILARYTPDLLVVGTRLSGGDGIDLVERARRPGMSIVVVGPAPSREVWRSYLAAGADRFVEPDRELEELREVVRALVRRPAADPAADPAGDPAAAPPAAPTLVGGRIAAGIVQDFNNHIHAIELLLDLLQRSPGDKHLWSETRVALDRAVCLTALLLGHVRGRPSPPAAQDV